ncbi:MAG: DUF4255 domain-containing protein [Chloroflexales bacterium]|nr:DUF4255 domain-containing protein [Chloroflexales bacterium]
MSSYMVLAAVSDALRAILWEAIDQDPVLRPIVASQEAIVFRNPTETAKDSANRLSFWLYQVTEDEFVKNQPMLRASGRQNNGDEASHKRRDRFPPLALNLFYLATPYAPSSEADHLLLGKTMQVMYDNAIVLLRDEANQIFEELRIILCRLSLDDISRVWEALQEPYRLSVCYQVRVARVDSARTLTHARVIERAAKYGEVV